jgi:predicted Zn-dependent protease
MRPSPPRSRRLVAALVALALTAAPVAPPPLVAAAAAQSLPDLGDAAQVGFSPAQERKLGEAIMRQARASGGLLNDPEVNDYLNELGNRLVAAAPDARQDFEFFAVPDAGINAFALPGGFVGVNAGLVLLAQSESELAAVLAHEITHVTQRHIARMLQGQQQSMLMSLAALAVALLAARAGGSSSGDLASAAIATSQALAIQNQINFTREFEYEADRIGFQRLAVAGFDVRAAGAFMERMQRSSRFLEGTTPSYLRTHPVTYERIAEAQARAHTFAYRQIPDSPDFHMVRALLRSYQGEAQEAVQFFQTALAERKFNDEIAVRYGLVAAYLRGKDYAKAKQALATLEKMAPQHPMIEAIAGHVLLESGEVEAAIVRLERALQRYPNKMQLVYDYPEALIKAGRYTDAAKFCDEQLARFSGNGTLHRTAARAYAGLDRKLKQHYHQGEYYAWLGNLRGAVDQLQLASRAGDANFYDASVIETRLRALRREIVEQQKEGFGRQG